MDISKEEIRELEQWLGARLPALLAHSDKVRQLLAAADGSQEMIKSAVGVVLGTSQSAPGLTPQQVATYKALLPLLAEHALLAVRAGGPVEGEDGPLTKDEAAAHLGISPRKLQRHMKKKQIAYEKYGTGKTASVRFRRSELDRFRASRAVSASKPQRPQG
jgi:excisionase family DNA binding protein